MTNIIIQMVKTLYVTINNLKKINKELKVQIFSL